MSLRAEARPPPHGGGKPGFKLRPSRLTSIEVCGSRPNLHIFDLRELRIRPPPIDLWRFCRLLSSLKPLTALSSLALALWFSLLSISNLLLSRSKIAVVPFFSEISAFN